MKKKLLFALVALLTTLSTQAADGDIFTAKTVEGVEMTFNVIDEAAKTCAVGANSISTSTSGTVTIPAKANGYSVTDIGYEAFSGCKDLTNIIIPKSVTFINDYAFWNCHGLTSIIIPEGVTSIGSAFEGCTGLTSITIPNGVTLIASYAFYGCRGLASITIPESVTAIGNYTFFECSGLTSITIPKNVTSIGEYNQEIKGETNVEIISVIA